MPMLQHRVLVVDDDAAAVERTHAWFVHEGHECSIVRRGKAALMHAATFNADVVLVDLLLRDADGLEIVRALKRQQPELYIAVAARWPRADTAFRVFAAGGDHYILKPASGHRLRFMLWDAEQRRGLPMRSGSGTSGGQ